VRAQCTLPRTTPFAVMVVSCLLASTARAQLDTPAASEARSALRAVQSAYQDYEDWIKWQRELNWPDVQYELWAGERGRPGSLEAAVAQLRAGRIPQFADAPFVRLAKALEARATELQPLPSTEWLSSCESAGEAFVPVKAELVETARATCRERLAAFARHYAPVRDPKNTWHQFLYWDEVEYLTARMPGPTPAPAELDRIEMRWSNVPTVWRDDLLFEASLAVRHFMRLLRAEMIGETAPQRTAAWTELAQLLTARAMDPNLGAPIAAAIRRRESLGQASPLTATIRRELSRPNLLLQIDAKWLSNEMRQPVDDSYDVNGVFAGTRSVGRGRMTGEMTTRVLPSSAVGRVELVFRGTSTARASGSQDRVNVVSRATTQVAATKPFRLDELGLTPERALAGATTSIVYESIDSPGLSRRRSQAVSETHARRPQAERESAAYARRSILEQINKQAATMAADFNRAYHRDIRDPRITAGRSAPRIRILADEQLVTWEATLEGPQSFAAASTPESYDCGNPVVMSVAPSTLEEQATINLGGRELTGAELEQQLWQRPVEAPPESQRKRGDDEFRVTFAPRPCEVQFVEGAVRLRLFVDKFDSEDVKYPAMTVDVAYKPEPRDGRLVLTREGKVKVMPLATAEGTPKLSGRQQTLRLAVERKLSKVLSSEIEGTPLNLPISEEDERPLRVENVRLAGEWLQMGLSPEPAPAS